MFFSASCFGRLVIEILEAPLKVVNSGRVCRLLYLSSFRNEGVFCEALAVKIRDDVAEALRLGADAVHVSLTQKARGGITITATA